MGKALVIYDSLYGNTEKVAKALAKGIEDGGLAVDCVRVDAVGWDRFGEYDLLAVGGPTQNRGASKPMKEFLDRLESAKGLTGKKALAFDTKYKFWGAGSAGAKIEEKLTSLGLTVIEPHASAIVKSKEGPLEEGSEEAFRQLGRKMADRR